MRGEAVKAEGERGDLGGQDILLRLRRAGG